ncbi:hypothetical protein J4450_07040 [Candidatus Micrarchaeota archaeon]|nr:hypothetical protein [Candidatus Micrarchaeota archaeon]
MRSTNFILIGVVLLVLVTSVFAVTYNYGPVSSIVFNIEEGSVSIFSINAVGSYSSGICSVSSTSTASLSYPRFDSGLADGATLKKGEKVNFKIRETGTTEPVDITLEITDIDATFTKDCSFWNPSNCDCENPQNKKVSFKVTVPSTYYCDDPDGNDINNFGTAAQRLISSSRTGNNIDLAAGALDKQDDFCYGAGVRERFCSIPSEGIRTHLSQTCSAGKTCVNGKCDIIVIALPQCTDSDGSNINTKGSVIRGNTLWDECVDENTVREFSCSGLSRVNTTVACGAGSRCNDGRCVSLALVDFCIDNDNGEALTVKGTARTGVRNPETLTETEVNEQTDYCFGSNDVVNEYVCEGSNRILREKPCPAGTVCSDGACVASAVSITAFCTENDGGREYNIKGITEVGIKNAAGVIVSSELFPDTCTGDRTVKEYYCLGNDKNAVETTCSPNERCINGACTGGSASMCTDSDNGIDTSKKGTVEIKQNNIVVSSSVDACVNEKTVNEYSCLGNVQSLSSVACAQGQVCKEGKCIVSGEENKKTMKFSKGWNLFSIPFKNAKISSTCDGFDLVKKRWYYDSETKQWTHPVSLEEGKGYWFKTKDDCTVDVEGDSFDISLKLNKGWNQIGSSSQKEEFESLLASCDVIHGPWGYSTEDKKYEKADKVLVGNGYFVKVSETCALE